MPTLPPRLHAAAPQLQGLLEQLRLQAQALHAPPPVLQAALGGDTFALLEWLIPQRGQLPARPVHDLIATAETILRARTYVHPALQERGPLVPVVFGTGGHRGEIAWGLTFAHVQAILQALLELIAGLTPAERLGHFGAESLAAVQQRGFIIGHDNRLFNPEFSFFSAALLARAGYRVGYGGRTATPELSLLVPRQGWAGSINFTPSHNPFRYGGIKLAPADGGLAGEDLTDWIEQRANALLLAQAPEQWPTFAELEQQVRAESQRVPRVDVHGPYLQGLEENPVARLGELVATLRALPAQQSLRWVVDPTWGASVPVYQLLQQRMGKGILTLIHTEDDPYFGGQTTEPNEQTLEDALTLLRAQHAPLGGAIRNDPDSDRGLVGDNAGAIKMNRYAVLVMRYLLDLGMDGGLLTTLPSSHFGPDFARARGKAVYITKTGFKNFRPYLKKGQALVAYEESDGLTIRGHTLDKDGIMGCLLAMRIVLHYGRSLGELLEEVQRELGTYYWLQDTFFIQMPARQAQAQLKALAAIRPGQALPAGGAQRTVAEVNAEDGYKFIFTDGTWMMMRPSGTEPKIRVYAETRTSLAATQALCQSGKELALRVMQGQAIA